MLSNGDTVFLAGADKFLLTSDGNRQLCYFIPLQPDSPPEFIPLKIQDNKACGPISYDPSENRIYWVDAAREIKRAFLNNGSSQVVIKSVFGVKSLEIDFVGRNLYLTDFRSIRVVSLDRSYHAVLVHDVSVRGIALDSSLG